MALHAKFVVSTIEYKSVGPSDAEGHQYGVGAIVTLRPIETDGDNKDVDGTPHGELRFGTLDEKATKHFETGQVYNLSLTLAGDEPAEVAAPPVPPVESKVSDPAPKPKAAVTPQALPQKGGKAPSLV